MNEENLSSLSYKELQTLAKEYGLKANSSKANLINLLIPILCVSNNGVEVGIITIEEKEEEMIVAVDDVLDSIEEEKVIEVSKEEIVNENIQDKLNVGDSAECLDYDEWTNCTIERINKLTMRVKITLTGKSKSLKFSQIRQITAIHHMDPIKEDEDDDCEKKEKEELLQIDEIELQTTIEMTTKNGEVNEEEFQEEEKIVEENNEQEEIEMTITQENDEKTFIEVKDQGVELLVNDVTVEWATSMEGCMAELSTKMIAKENAKIATLVPKPWNSCVKSPFKAKIEIEQMPEFKKSFGNTPVKKERKPSLMPKSTKAQLARQEAIKEKMQSFALEKIIEDGVTNAIPTPIIQKQSKSSNPTPSTTFNLSNNKITPKFNPTPTILKSVKSGSSSRLSLYPTSSSSMSMNRTINSSNTKKRSSMSMNNSSFSNSQLDKKVKINSSLSKDFSNVHQKQFDKMKSITSIINRDENISIKMNNAMETAKCKNPFADIVKKTVLTSRNDNTPVQNEIAPFKARSMPKFTTIHEKNSNKENSSTLDRILEVNNNNNGLKNTSRLDQINEIKSSGPFSFH